MRSKTLAPSFAPSSIVSLLPRLGIDSFFPYFFRLAMALPIERSEAAALARLLQVSLSPPSTSEVLYLPELSKVRGCVSGGEGGGGEKERKGSGD